MTAKKKGTTRPFIFDAEEVQQLLGGEKTMHFIPVKTTLPFCRVGAYMADDVLVEFVNIDGQDGDPVDGPEITCPLGKPGDRVWVKETWHPLQYTDIRLERKRTDFFYRATNESEVECDPRFERWRSPVVMPRHASRITLKIKEVKGVRLRDVSEKDAIAAGARSPLRAVGSRLDAFLRALGKKHRNATWERNPWLWAVTFERV